MTINPMKIVCVLYDDPVSGYPKDYPRDSLPSLMHYPDGQVLPTPDAIDFKPGSLLGSVSGELGLRQFLEQAGHEFIVTADKEGRDSEFEQHLVDADVVISQPFWPAYLTAERMAQAHKLKLAITAGIGSDHVDLDAAMALGVTVAEVTYCNSISVAEHTVMMILSLVRDYMSQHQTVLAGGWNIADCVARSYDLEGMKVGLVGAGRIGQAVLKRLKGFDVELHYTDRHRLPSALEQEYGCVYHEDLDALIKTCDVISLHCPLHGETEYLFDEARVAKMKRGAYLINTARGKLCEPEAIEKAVNSGQLAGYAGDVWFPQPAPVNHPWRHMPHQAMTPHTSGSTLSAQARYAAGTREILECWLQGRPIRPDYLIVENGHLAGTGAKSYSAGNATKGIEELA